MNLRHRTLLSASAIAVGLSSPIAAHAQETASPQASAPAQLAEVIVTASRREENLQRTGIAVSAVSSEDLARQGVLQAQDLNKAVPGLTLSPNGAATQVYMRGVGTFSIAPFADSAVAVNLDQVVLGFPGMIAGNFYDLARVEVLKGPQGTLYGRNASAGAINLITNKPVIGDTGGDVSLELGDFSLARVAGAVSIPVNDKIALRAAGQVVSRDGYFAGGSGDDKSESLRLQGLFEPSDSLSLLVSADYSRIHGRGSPYVPLGSSSTSDPWADPASAESNAQLLRARAFGSGRGLAPLPPYGPGTPFQIVRGLNYNKAELWGLRAEINWDLGFATLTVLPAYRHMDTGSISEPGFSSETLAQASQTSLEVRLASPADQPLRWIVGAYGYDSDINSVSYVNQGVVLGYQAPDQTNRSYAAFGELTYRATDALRLTGGLRYTSETRDQTGGSTSTQFVAPQGPFLPPAPIPPFAQTSGFSYPGSLDDDDVSGRISIDFDLAPQSLLYATVSTGFKAGGLNPDLAPSDYKAEKLTAYTVGSKNRFLDGRLQANLEAFYWDYQNHQEVVVAPLRATNGATFAPITRNIGKASLQGVNVDLQYLITPDDLVIAQIEYLDATFDNFAFDVPTLVAPIMGVSTTCKVSTPSPSGSGGASRVDCSGKPFTRAPKWSAVVGYQHTFRLGDGKLVAGFNAQMASSSYVATDYIPDELQKAYVLTDLNLGYEAPDGRWSLTGYARNIGDEAVASGGFQHPFIPGLVYGTLRPPRTYSAVLKVSF